MAITKILNIQAADDRNPATHLKNAIEYIQNPDKTEECVLVGSINCLPDTAFEQMLETKKLYNKTGKRQGYHIILSFSPEEVVTPEQALYVVEHFVKDVLGDEYETVYTVHTDKEHMHAHLIWNSVSLVTGKKYNSPKGNWKNKLQPITNKYCEELGLEICPAEYSKNPVNMTRDEWQKEQELAKLKEEKKRAKHDYKLAGNVLRENTYTALSVGLENEAVMDADKVVVSEDVSMRGVENDLNNAIEEDVISETAVFEEVKLEDAVCEDTMLDERDVVSEAMEEKLSTDKKGYESATEQRQDFAWSNEDIMSGKDSEVEMSDSLQEKVTTEVAEVALVDALVQNTTQTGIVSDFPKRYTEYMALALENRVELHGLFCEELDATVFDIVRKNFNKAGYSVGFDEIYGEATAIEKYISKQRSINSAEMIAEKLKGYGSYEKIPSRVKAEVFGFEIGDSSGNLTLYMQVMKVLGVRMSQEEMFEDYQKVYEEAIKKQAGYDMEKEKIWEHGSR